MQRLKWAGTSRNPIPGALDLGVLCSALLKILRIAAGTMHACWFREMTVRCYETESKSFGKFHNAMTTSFKEIFYIFLLMSSTKILRRRQTD